MIDHDLLPEEYRDVYTEPYTPPKGYTSLVILIALVIVWAVVLVLANLVVDHVIAESGQLTATYGADQWHAQLTALATGVP